MLNLDIYCQIVDNYGDIGIAYRLAKLFASKPNFKVTLWLSKPAPAEFVLSDRRVHVKIVGIDLEVKGDFLITTFSSLPPAFLGDVKEKHLDLGYMSLTKKPIEISDVTGRESYYPGLTNGFLIGNSDYLTYRPENLQYGTRVLWFTYDQKMPKELVTALSGKDNTVVRSYGDSFTSQTAYFKNGYHTISNRPFERFLSQEDFDYELSVCHVNFVRGEDSFARAQLSGNLVIWSPYPGKFSSIARDTFLEKYTSTWTDTQVEAYLDFCDKFYNKSNTGLDDSWKDLHYQLPSINKNLLEWKAYITSLGCIGDKMYQRVLELTHS